MATKAQQYRAAQERSGAKRVKVTKKLHTRDPAHTMTRHMTKRGDKKSGPALEDSMSGRPSRRSTRPSSNHGRTDTGIMRAVLNASESPGAQAKRAASARRK